MDEKSLWRHVRLLLSSSKILSSSWWLCFVCLLAYSGHVYLCQIRLVRYLKRFHTCQYHQYKTLAKNPSLLLFSKSSWISRYGYLRQHYDRDSAMYSIVVQYITSFLLLLFSFPVNHDTDLLLISSWISNSYRSIFDVCIRWITIMIGKKMISFRWFMLAKHVFLPSFVI